MMWSMPSATMRATGSALSPSGGKSDSPRPGRSGTSTRYVSASTGMLRTQCRHEPAPPWNSTTTGALPPTCPTDARPSGRRRTAFHTAWPGAANHPARPEDQASRRRSSVPRRSRARQSTNTDRHHQISRCGRSSLDPQDHAVRIGPAGQTFDPHRPMPFRFGDFRLRRRGISGTGKIRRRSATVSPAKQHAATAPERG